MSRLGKIRLLKCPKLLNKDLTGQEVHCLLAFQPMSEVGFEIGKPLRRWSKVGFGNRKGTSEVVQSRFWKLESHFGGGPK